jgi:hypothetical protein
VGNPTKEFKGMVVTEASIAADKLLKTPSEVPSAEERYKL